MKITHFTSIFFFIFEIILLDNFKYVAGSEVFTCDIEDIVHSGEVIKIHVSATPKIIHLEPRSTYE